MPPSDAVPPQLWTQHDAARGYTTFARRCEALFAALGPLAPRLDGSRATVAAATLARQLGAHAAAWGELVPESVLLEDARAAAEPMTAVPNDLESILAAIADVRLDLEEFLIRSSDLADTDARALARRIIQDIDASWAGMRPAATGSANR